MPELPEVESMRRLLQNQLYGAKIVGFNAPFPVVVRYPEVATMEKEVIGKTIECVDRRGKYLLLTLTSNLNKIPQTLIIHLKMRGILRVEKSDLPPAPYLCAKLALEDKRELRFHDMWRWGGLWLVNAEEGFDPIPGLRDIGVEPLSPDFTVEVFAKQLTRKRGKLKPILLDQRTVAGVGNIYADESLHRAGLHPEKRVESLTEAEISRLHLALTAVLIEAVESGGAYAELIAKANSTLEDFSEVYKPKVYDREGLPCPTCEKPLTKFQLQGRGTTFCPHCQPSTSAPTGQTPEKSIRTERSVSAYV